jgi:hypothetical protein
MVLLELLTLGSVAYAFAGCISSAKTARLEHELEKRGELDVVRDFDLILKINRVDKTYGAFIDDKIPVLPANGYQECLQFIREQPLTTKADEDRFIAHYNKIRRKDLDKRQEIFNNQYNSYRKRYYENLEQCNNPNTEDKLITFVFRREYWLNNLNGYEHQQRVNRIYYETFFGDIATQPAKLLYNSEKNSYTEVWHVSFWSKYQIDKYYSICCKKVGYSDYWSI